MKRKTSLLLSLKQLVKKLAPLKFIFYTLIMLTKNKLTLNHLRHWFDRILISDPGKIRLNRALRIILSVLTSVVLLSFIIQISGIGQITDIIFGGAFSMICTMVVVEQDKKPRIITTLLLPISASLSITINAFLSKVGYHLSDIAIVLAIFLAFYLQRFGMRYFSLSMAGFFSIYISSLLHVQFGQLLFLYVALFVGTLVTFIYNFLLLDIRSDTLLKRTMISYHRRMNQTYNLIIDGMYDLSSNPKRLKRINHNINILNEYARMISEQLVSTHPNEVWPGITPRLLRIYVFDTEMLIQTIFPAFKRLKYLHALDRTELRKILIRVIKALRDADVLEAYNNPSHLNEAQIATGALREELSKLNSEDPNVLEWLYLIRRIESIANHVINEAKHLQQVRQVNLDSTSPIAIDMNHDDVEENIQKKEETGDSSKNIKEKGLPFTTKKAFQASVAGTLSIFAGYLLSPSHQYWVILTAFVVLLGTESVGRTYVKGFQRTSGTIIGAIAGFGLASILPPSPIIKMIVLFFCLFMAFYIFILSYSVMIFWITMMIAMMYDLLMGGITPQLLGDRIIDTLIGVGLGLLATAFLFPKRTAEKVTESMEAFFEELRHYLIDYIDTFIGDTLTTNMTDKAFNLDAKMQLIRDEADPLRRRFASTDRSEIERRLTVLTAINYYAKQLIASSHRKDQLNNNVAFHHAIKHIENCLKENIASLCTLIHGKGHPVLWRLDDERDRFERSSDFMNLSPDQKTEFIHDFYYIWRINASLVTLGKDLGAHIKSGKERHNKNDVKETSLK